MPGGDPAKCGLTIEHDMRGITSIVPIGETRIVGLKAGHQRQDPAGAKHPIQAPEFLRRTVEVLDDFGAGDEVIVVRKRRRVRKERRVIHLHSVPGLGEHRRECGSRATTVIKTCRCRRKALQQRCGQAVQEGTIACVVRMVAVQSVLYAFRREAQALLRVQEGGHTDIAAPVLLRLDEHELACRRSFTDWT